MRCLVGGVCTLALSLDYNLKLGGIANKIGKMREFTHKRSKVRLVGERLCALAAHIAHAPK